MLSHHLLIPHALRSNYYLQGKGCLRSSDHRYDVLGVVCDLFLKTFDYDPYIWVIPLDVNNRACKYSCIIKAGKGLDYHGRRKFIGYPPQDILDYYGIHREGMLLAVRMNDVDRASFDEIADYMESHPYRFFNGYEISRRFKVC